MSSNTNKKQPESQEEALTYFNTFLEEMFLQQRWTSLEEIKVSNKFNWQKFLSSQEFLKILQWTLIVNLRMGLIPLLSNLVIYVFVLALHIFIGGFFIHKNYNERQKESNFLVRSIAKEALMFLVLFLTFEDKFIGLPLPYFIKSVSFYFFAFLVFTQISILSDVQLTYQLSQKISIEGADWTVTRLPMMNQKAVELQKFYSSKYKQLLNLKKSK